MFFSKKKMSNQSQSCFSTIIMLNQTLASCTSSILLAMNTSFSSKHLSPTDVAKGKLEYARFVKPRIVRFQFTKTPFSFCYSIFYEIEK